MVDKKTKKWTLNILFICLTLITIFFIPDVSSYNYGFVNVTTTVNITNAAPEILNNSLNGGINVILNAGGAKLVQCNATIRDYNGFNDISVTNATLYYYLNNSNDLDDYNEHYTNTSCVESANDGVNTANYTCSFYVKYFANNGTWDCNVSVNDSFNFIDSNMTTGIFDALYALNVTNVIDYGKLAITETSANITANVTNFGNTDINVSVLGYGATEGDGLGFVCSVGTNISVSNERFSSSTVPWASKTPLSTLNQDMALTLLQQVNDVTQVKASTYWQLYVPPNPFGVCNGTVKFTATTP